MSVGTAILGRMAAAMLVAAMVAAAVHFFGSPGSAGRIAASRHIALLNEKLKFLRMPPHGLLIVGLQSAAVVGSLGYAVAQSQPLVAVTLPAIVFLPIVFLNQRVALRIAALEAQIEPWLNAIANALKASPSLGEAISASASLVGAPMREEVDVVIKEYELGTPLDRALESFAQRMNSKTLNGCVMALQIARRSGGNLPEMLESAATALREMARLEGVVRTKTAEGKAQAFVIGMIPAPMVLLINWLEPTFLDPLLVTFTGHLILGAAAVLWASAIALSRKILDVDI